MNWFSYLYLLLYFWQKKMMDQNAMPQASIRPEADYLVKKKSAVQYAVG